MARKEAAEPFDQDANVSRTDGFEHPMFGTVWASRRGNLITRVRWSSTEYGANGASMESNPKSFPDILRRLGLTSQGMLSRGRVIRNGE